MTPRLRDLVVVAILVATALPAFGCDDKKTNTDSARSDAGAGADKYATADPKLEKALQAAASASAAAADNGPPPDGIFAPGAADQRHAKGAPTKVDIVSEGADPKVSLAPTVSAAADASADSARASSYGPAALELGMQLSKRVAMPTIDLALVFGPAKKDDGGADWLVGEVKKSAAAKQQLGQLPPGVDKEIGSLEGTTVRIKLTPDGRESDLQMQLGKSSKSELDMLGEAAAEALVFATIPLPPKPVGVGAQWIAETRMPLATLDVVAYRAYRIKSIEGDRLHLTMDVKAYAASKTTQLQGLPAGAELLQYDGTAQGELEVVRGETLARKSDVQQHVLMIFQGKGGATPPTQPGQPPGNVMPAEIESQATFVRGDDLRAASRGH
jgi:hypothetical protein